MRITAARANRTLPIAVRKLVATGPRVSTIVQTADPELFLPLLNNTAYHLRGGLITNSAADAAGDIAYSFAWTGTMTVIRTTVGPANTIATGSVSDMESAPGTLDSATPTTAIGYGSTIAGTSVPIDAYVEVGNTAGDLTLLWAQNSSNVNGTTLQIGSWMIAFPVAFSAS